MRQTDHRPSRPPIRRLVVFVGCLAVSLTIAACGSSGAGSAGASPSSATTSASSSSAAAASPPTATATTTVAAASDRSSLPPLRVGDQAGTGQQALLQAAGLLHTLPF